MGVVLARLVFALVAGSALLASTGLAVPPHRVEPGTPLYHNMVLGAYRFAFLIDSASEPAGPLTPEMAALHKALALAGMPITNMPGMGDQRGDQGPIIATAGLDPMQELAIAFALLIVIAPRLARPTRRPIADMPLRQIAPAQWLAPTVLQPPRLLVLPHSA